MDQIFSNSLLIWQYLGRSNNEFCHPIFHRENTREFEAERRRRPSEQRRILRSNLWLIDLSTDSLID